MNPAEKGAYYARLFRKAGIFLGKGNVARAITVLEEGRAFAEQQGDRAMARRFAIEVARASAPPSTADN
jgi:hypothetical protein